MAVNTMITIQLLQVNGQVKQTAMKMFKKKLLPFPEPIRKFLWLDIIKNSAKKSESKGSKKSKVKASNDNIAMNGRENYPPAREASRRVY